MGINADVENEQAARVGQQDHGLVVLSDLNVPLEHCRLPQRTHWDDRGRTAALR